MKRASSYQALQWFFIRSDVDQALADQHCRFFTWVQLVENGSPGEGDRSVDKVCPTVLIVRLLVREDRLFASNDTQGWMQYCAVTTSRLWQ